MNKKVVFLVFVIFSVFFLLGFIYSNSEVISLTGNFLKETENKNQTSILEEINNSPKIASKVIEEIQKEEKIRIIVELEEPEKKDRRILGRFISEKELAGKKRHDFRNKASLEVTKEELAELEKNSRVKNIDLVGKKYLFLEDSVPIINASPSWNIQINGTNLTGKGETVCVLDTGIDFSHQDLQGQNKSCIIDCTNNSCIENCSLGDFHGHGTHVAGIIAANGNIKGVAPEAGLIGIKVCSFISGGVICYNDDILAGIEWCISNKNNYDISLISMSLGGGQYNSYCDSEEISSGFTSAINDAVGNNISVVVATGNTNGNYPNATAGIASPACIENSTRVTATSDSDNFASFAFRHKNFQDILTAPGVSIVSTIPGSYGTSSGTSMSAPHVSGAFAIINQFKKLEKKPITPREITLSLNSTGKIIYDSISGGNFSRINLYSSLLSLDKTPPQVNLILPENNYFSETNNMTLKCNSTDELQLKNLTIKLWNSEGDIINYSDFEAINNSLIAEKIFINLDNGEYSWNCFSYDKQGNKGFNLDNKSFYIGYILTNLFFPDDLYYTNNETNFFNCSAQTSENSELLNITFYLWEKDSSTLIYNQTKNISGNRNSTLFNYSFQNQTEYLWNCLTKTNDSSFSTNIINYTLIYDSTPPEIDIISPENSQEFIETENLEFRFNLTERNPNQCSLIIDNSIINTNSSINTNINSFSHKLSPGTYLWKISCFDLADNQKNSSEREILISKQISRTSSISRTTISSTDSKEIYFLEEKEFFKGATKIIKKRDKINFKFESNSHELELNDIQNNRVNITIRSRTFNIFLKEGETRKIDLNADNYYDLFIKLNLIELESANITLKQINEEIPSKSIFNEEDNSYREQSFNDSQGFLEVGDLENENKRKNIYLEAFFFFLIIFAILFFILLKIKEYIHKNKK